MCFPCCRAASTTQKAPDVTSVDLATLATRPEVVPMTASPVHAPTMRPHVGKDHLQPDTTLKANLSKV